VERRSGGAGVVLVAGRDRDELDRVLAKVQPPETPRYRTQAPIIKGEG
jgi:hypothetical protein